jgi:hypothetical protein
LRSFSIAIVSALAGLGLGVTVFIWLTLGISWGRLLVVSITVVDFGTDLLFTVDMFNKGRDSLAFAGMGSLVFTALLGLGLAIYLIVLAYDQE